MNRRKFFSFLPIAPAALVVDGARANDKVEQPSDSTISISITGSKKNEHYDPRFISYPHVSDPSKSVSMAVGQDGNLWIKSKNDNVWKRVVTE